MERLLEKDLYTPVKELFENLGFAVKAEILNCDVVAHRGENHVAIELKTKLNLEVILQAADRQKFVDISYIAVFATGIPKNKKKMKSIEYLLKRLEIGLVLVDVVGTRLVATLIFDGLPYDRRQQTSKNKRKAMALQKEFKQRFGDGNIGGTTRCKRMTAYRQDALGLALLLEEGPLTTKEIREKRPYYNHKISILQINYYGWFKRLERGLYTLTEVGLEELNALNIIEKTEFVKRVSQQALE